MKLDYIYISNNEMCKGIQYLTRFCTQYKPGLFKGDICNTPPKRKRK